MSNFARALRLALARKLNVAMCLGASLVVALLWAANLAPVMFVVDVVMKDLSVPEWIDLRVEELSGQVSEFDAERATLVEAEDPPGRAAALARIDYDRQATARWIERYQQAKPWADRWLPTTPFGTLVAVLTFLLVGTLVKNVFRFVNLLLVARLAARATLDLRNTFYDKVLGLDLADFGEQGRGDLMNRCTTDLENVGVGIKALFGVAVREPLKMIACFVGAAVVSWRLLLLTIIVAPVTVFAIRYLSRALKRANRRAMEELSSIYETLGETLSSIRLIKAHTSEPAERARFATSNQTLYQRQMRIAMYNALVSPVAENLGVAMVVLAAMAGGFLVLGGQTHLLGLRISDTPLTHGQMSVFFVMLAGMSEPARRLSNVFNLLQLAAASADRVYGVLDRTSTIVSPPKPTPLPTPLRAVEFSNVHFRYDPDKPVLEGVDFEVRPGETIAIVGPNGCGKSTLLSLVPRFYDVSAGAIRLGGVDVRDASLEELRSRIGVVSQQAHLLNDTVEANIAYGSPGASREQIEQAAKKAYAHGFVVEKLADGYQTLVGVGGGKLSGGQRQRVALARAILRDPELLILDEATSQVDVESEQLIHQVLRRFTHGRTTLIITHRPSTLSLADRVVVMDKGQIEDIGAPEELLDRCDLFRRLCHVGYRESA